MVAPETDIQLTQQSAFGRTTTGCLPTGAKVRLAGRDCTSHHNHCMLYLVQTKTSLASDSNGVVGGMPAAVQYFLVQADLSLLLLSPLSLISKL